MIQTAFANGLTWDLLAEGIKSEPKANLMLERLEDEMGYKIPDHCVAVLAVDPEAGVTLYDPAYGEMPLMMPTSRFLDAWEDSGNFAVVVCQ